LLTTIHFENGKDPAAGLQAIWLAAGLGLDVKEIGYGIGLCLLKNSLFVPDIENQPRFW
jgi:hypothetical protein